MYFFEFGAILSDGANQYPPIPDNNMCLLLLNNGYVSFEYLLGYKLQSGMIW